MKLFGKLFGSSNEEGNTNPIVTLVSEALGTTLSKAGLNLSFDIEIDENGEFLVELFGEDEEILVARDGQLLDALQLYVKRVLQHQLPEENVAFSMDCGGFRERINESLMEMADKLKADVIDISQSRFIVELSPPKTDASFTSVLQKMGGFRVVPSEMGSIRRLRYLLRRIDIKRLATRPCRKIF